MRGYSTSDVAHLLGLTERQIRVYARSGVLFPERGPRGGYRFGFQDLVLLRTAAALSRAHVPLRRILAALRRTREQLPAGRSLTELRIRADGEEVLVSEGGSAWNPESGQIVLDFSVAELAAEVAPLARRLAASAEADELTDAEEWYRLAVELEAVAPAEARDAYQRALALDANHADAHVNLGRLLHDEGRAEEAAAHYRRALLAAGTHAVAAYNLGVALEDLERPAEAMRAYARALAADERLADAHYNLARLYEQQGEAAAALRHYRAYRELAGTGSTQG